MTPETRIRRPDTPPTAARRRPYVVGLAMAAAVLVVVRAVSPLLEAPASIPMVTFENPSGYDLEVSVTGAERDGWMPVGLGAGRRSTTVVRDVVDQGSVWIFSFAAQGEEGGELRITRRDLEQRRWRVSIPGRIGAQLARRGAALPA